MPFSKQPIAFLSVRSGLEKSKQATHWQSELRNIIKNPILKNISILITRIMKTAISYIGERYSAGTMTFW